MFITRLCLLTATVLGFAPANAATPDFSHVADLPLAQISSPSKELALLSTRLTEGRGDGIPTATRVQLPSGYAEGYKARGTLQALPGGWTMTTQSRGGLRTHIVATLRRGDSVVEVDFAGGGTETVLSQMLGAPAPIIFGVIDLNSRYMAVHGSGAGSYRFVDKQSGEVLPYMVAGNPNHQTNLFVDRNGAVYVEIVKRRICRQYSLQHNCINEEVTTASSPNVDRQADGLRTLQVGAVSLTAPLTQSQVETWNASLEVRR